MLAYLHFALNPIPELYQLTFSVDDMPYVRLEDSTAGNPKLTPSETGPEQDTVQAETVEGRLDSDVIAPERRQIGPVSAIFIIINRMIGAGYVQSDACQFFSP